MNECGFIYQKLEKQISDQMAHYTAGVLGRRNEGKSLMRTIVIALIITLGFNMAPLHAASFNCSKATTETETTICGNPELSALDDVLGFLWRLGINKNQAEVKLQNDWLLKRNTCGSSEVCISATYRQNLRQISGINDTLVSWKHNREILHPYCFIKEWYSSDNYKEYYEQYTGVKENYYRTKKYKKFSTNIGQFFGSTITNYGPIKASWGDSVELAVSIDSCKNKSSLELNVADQKVTAKETTGDEDAPFEYYEILASVSTNSCHKLAPNIVGVCKEAYILNVVDYGGGRMGPKKTFVVYGLFDISDDIGYIIPLKNFKLY